MPSPLTNFAAGRTESSLPEGEYEVITNEATHLVRNRMTGTVLGGLGESYYRPWVFPLYAPSGRTVLSAFPHAHPWHNGLFVGASPVIQGSRTANFWTIPIRRALSDPVIERGGRIETAKHEISTEAQGVRFSFEALWRDEDGQPILREDREIAFLEMPDGHFCDLTTRKWASYGALSFPKSKFGGLGIRCEPLLTPEAGGKVLADEKREGDASCVHEGFSDFVAYQANLPAHQGGALGICLLALDGDRRGPWFVRNFGMALYNPLCLNSLDLPENACHALSMRVVAYDGFLTASRVRAWASIALPHSPP